MKILAVSDEVDRILYGPSLESYARGVEAVISCGDLPFEYLEYLVTILGVPLFYVLGNHDPPLDGPKHPEGCIPLDGRIEEVEGVKFAGLSGSRLYSRGANQYTESQMRRRALALSASIWRGKLLGREAPRVFVSHAPPFGIGDREDPCHTGFEVFLKLMDRYHPALWLHGHVHLYGPDQERVTDRKETRIVNVFNHQILEV